MRDELVNFIFFMGEQKKAPWGIKLEQLRTPWFGN